MLPSWVAGTGVSPAGLGSELTCIAPGSSEWEHRVRNFGRLERELERNTPLARIWSRSSGGQASGAAAAAVLCLSVVGCSSPEEDRFLSYNKLNELYLSEVASFPWALPAGTDFPETIPVADVGGLWEDTNARAMAYFYWECQWGKLYLAERVDNPVAAAAALEKLQIAVTDPYLDPFYENPEEIWGDALDKAALGDASLLGEFVEGSCAD